jgi:hypothetical protein
VRLDGLGQVKNSMTSEPTGVVQDITEENVISRSIILCFSNFVRVIKSEGYERGI